MHSHVCACRAGYTLGLAQVSSCIGVNEKQEDEECVAHIILFIYFIFVYYFVLPLCYVMSLIDFLQLGLYASAINVIEL